ncbi:hypothetical protein [Clostridium sp.]|uniref:hypothetical protein n=1 Tax=Clostridium sp. TaxID=1506 RepID=UPI0032175E61
MSKQKTRIMKPVYFNLEDEREKEIADWLESKFSGFGGLVKDLLYTQMLQERGLLKRVEPNKLNVTTENNEEVTCDTMCIKDDVEEYDC